MITLAFWSYLLATTLYRKNNNPIVFYDLLKVIDLTKKYVLIIAKNTIFTVQFELCMSNMFAL